MALQALIDDFVSMLRNERFYSPHTCTNYQRDLQLFADFLGDRTDP